MLPERRVPVVQNRTDADCLCCSSNLPCRATALIQLYFSVKMWGMMQVTMPTEPAQVADGVLAPFRHGARAPSRRRALRRPIGLPLRTPRCPNPRIDRRRVPQIIGARCQDGLPRERIGGGHLQHVAVRRQQIAYEHPHGHRVAADPGAIRSGSSAMYRLSKVSSSIGRLPRLWEYGIAQRHAAIQPARRTVSRRAPQAPPGYWRAAPSGHVSSDAGRQVGLRCCPHRVVAHAGTLDRGASSQRRDAGWHQGESLDRMVG